MAEVLCCLSTSGPLECESRLMYNVTPLSVVSVASARTCIDRDVAMGITTRHYQSPTNCEIETLHSVKGEVKGFFEFHANIHSNFTRLFQTNVWN